MESTSNEMKEEYNKYTARKIIFIIVSLALVVFLFFVSICVGTLELSIPDVYHYLLNHIAGVTYPPGSTDAYNDNIVWNYRVPRALFAIIAGASLAIAGSVMQSVMKNPLADPYTTGVSSGALLGVALALILGFSLTAGAIDRVAIVTNAIVFSLIPVLVMVLMAPYFRRSPSTLVLAGVAISFLFSSFTSILLVSTDAANLSMVYHWQIGTFGDLSWDALPLTAITTVIGAAILLPMAKKLNLMAIDDKAAKSMGLNIERLRVICLVLISIMVSVMISYVGIIAFVGLVVPHIIRILLGADNKYLMPAAAAFGALFLLGCDIISRALDVGATIPVGVTTAFFGAPIFLYLIIQQKKGVW